MCQFPSHAVRGGYRFADLDPTSSTIGVEAAEPEVMFTCPVHQPLEARREILDLSAHRFSVSISASKGVSGSIPTFRSPMHLMQSLVGL